MDRRRRVGLHWMVLGLAATIGAAGGCHDRTVEVSLDKAIDYREIRTGSGMPAREGSLVEVHYVGRLSDGTPVVDTRSRRAHRFIVGDGTVIPGMDTGVRGMRAGGVREVTLPPHAHYGRMGYADAIPPETVLTFEIEMLRVSSGGSRPLAWSTPEAPGD